MTIKVSLETDNGKCIKSVNTMLKDHLADELFEMFNKLLAIICYSENQ